MYRIVFYGTSAFAVPALQALASDEFKDGFEIVRVVTQPDRPVGRHAVMTPTPVKVAALELGLDVSDNIGDVKFEAAVVASYGNIIKQNELDLAPHQYINIHASLLPKYRGASPIREAIKNGDTETGITFMEMDAKMDHGPILRQLTLPISETDTTWTLTEKLAQLAADYIGVVLFDVLKGNYPDMYREQQDESKATYTKLIKKEDGLVDLDAMNAEQVLRLIRANDPWPGTFFMKDGKRVKIISAHNENDVLVLDVVQPEGKKPMPWADYLRGLKA